MNSLLFAALFSDPEQVCLYQFNLHISKKNLHQLTQWIVESMVNRSESWVTDCLLIFVHLDSGAGGMDTEGGHRKGWKVRPLSALLHWAQLQWAKSAWI